MRKLVTLTALLFVVLTSSLWGDFNPSTGFLLEPIQRDTEVELNYFHEDNSPASILWDINADGTYDTTTTERTLVYDYITYDTTQVIAKAIFDSTTFDMDTVSIALYDNRLPVTYDTMWVCTLETSSFLVNDIADSGNCVLVRDIVFSGDQYVPNSYVINNCNSLTHFDSTDGGWIIDNTGNCLLYKFGFDEEYNRPTKTGLIYVDSTVIAEDSSGTYDYFYLTEDRTSCLGYNGSISNTMHNDGMGDVINDVVIMSSDLSYKTTITKNATAPFDEENLAHNSNLDFIATIMRNHPILTIFNKDCDTLFTKTDVYNFAPDSASYLGALISIDDNDYIYTLIGYSFDSSSSFRYFDNAMSNSFNLLVKKYDTAGVLHDIDTMTNIKTGKIILTEDAKYMIGCTETQYATKQMVCLWDFQTKELLFEHWFENSNENTLVDVDYVYNKNTDCLILNVYENGNRFWLDKNGQQVYNPYPEIKFFSKTTEYAYQRNYNRLTIYRVEWEATFRSQ